jgi:SpoIID/LytB domain protein
MIQTDKEPAIKVGIMQSRQITFELYGDYKTSGSQNYFSGRFTAEVSGNKIICKKGTEKLEFGEIIEFQPRDIGTDTFLIRDVIIGSQFHWERKEKQRFIGSLTLQIINDSIQIINTLPLEKYLTSVISSEMSARSSIQFLKAHAVVSRSWVLAQLEKSGKKKPKKETSREQQKSSEILKWYNREEHVHFDVCSDDHCQRYQGITKIVTDTARQAVNQTYGIVLASDNNICDTRYSKACGGITESFENTWEPVHFPYLTSIVDYKFEPDAYTLDFSSEENASRWINGSPAAYCNTREKKILSQILNDYDQETINFYRWEVEYTQSELSGILKEKTGIDFGDIMDITPLKRGDSSRIIKIEIKGTKNSLIAGKELEIRRILAKTHLYSSAFVVDKQNVINGIPSSFILRGAGWGHGVGLCQIGAAVMAMKGFQFDEILLHYFSGARLLKLY